MCVCRGTTREQAIWCWRCRRRVLQAYAGVCRRTARVHGGLCAISCLWPASPPSLQSFTLLFFEQTEAHNSPVPSITSLSPPVALELVIFTGLPAALLAVSWSMRSARFTILVFLGFLLIGWTGLLGSASVSLFTRRLREDNPSCCWLLEGSGFSFSCCDNSGNPSVFFAVQERDLNNGICNQRCSASGRP